MNFFAKLLIYSEKKLPKVAKSCQKLPKVGKIYQKLPKVTHRQFYISQLCALFLIKNVLNIKAKIGVGLAAVAAAVGGFFLIRKGTSLIETAENVNVELLGLPKIHKIDLTGLKISLDLKVDNPARGRLSLKFPSIRAYYNRALIASTAISDKTYAIEPVSSGKISGIMIEASYLNLLQTAPAIVTDFMGQGTKIIDKLGFDVIAEVNGIPLKVQKL